MKLNKDFSIQDMFDEQILFSTGESEFNGVVRINKTAVFIVDCLKTDTTKEEIINAMRKKYDASIEDITADVEEGLAILRSIGALDE